MNISTPNAARILTAVNSANCVVGFKLLSQSVISKSNHTARSADFQVCCVAGFQTRRPPDLARAADLEIGDTAGLETCATSNLHRDAVISESRPRQAVERRN